MGRHGENIHKRKDGRWEARVIQSHDFSGKAKYRYFYGKTYLEAKKKRISFWQTGEKYRIGESMVPNRGSDLGRCCLNGFHLEKER